MEKHAQSFDVCVVCALPEEVRAFLEVARTQCEGAIEERSSLRYHYSYRFATIKNQKGEPLSLHISWLPRYGPQEMTLHLSRILEECQPRIALMTGICAGDAQRVQLGDLVVAERTFTYDNGKFTLDEQGRSVHEHDTMTYQLDANIMQFLGLFKDWKPLVEGLERPPSPPEIKLNRHEVRSHVKAMASVSAVRADNPFEDVRAPVRGTVAIDMEGAAFGLVMSRHPLIPWLVVKGVCDYADRDKNDSYHDYAARASALYALSFIRAYVTNERLPRPDVPFLPKERAGMAQNDWGDAPDVPVFFGRTKELIVLEQWIVEDRCRLVALVGMKGIGKTRLSVKLGRGGIGKTDLSLKLARGIEAQFNYVIWRSLLNAPKLSELLTDLVKFLSDQREVVLPDVVSEQISRLLHYLRKSRCLVILDNAEMLLQGGKQVGQYHPGYQEYGQLFEQVAEVPHQSCLLLTSREKMPEIARLESRTGPVRLLEVRGLDYSDGKKIFAEIGSFSGSKEDWKRLNSFYNGNPLALQLAAHHIKEVFFGSISDFLREGKPIFADLQGLLDWHFDRLSDGHKEVMYWFAINREPTSLSELREDIPSQVGKEQIASTLQSLQRLIPLEKSPKSFTLQPVLMEYMTQRFVERVVEEVKNGKIYLFNTHALLKTSVSDYVRDVQRRLILKSMSEKLLRIYGNRPCSSQVYQVAPMPANSASSSLRSPGVLRRAPGGNPTCCGTMRSRRVRKNWANSVRRSFSFMALLPYPSRCYTRIS
jgi:nucleoside phosphorylase